MGHQNLASHQVQKLNYRKSLRHVNVVSGAIDETPATSWGMRGVKRECLYYRSRVGIDGSRLIYRIVIVFVDINNVRYKVAAYSRANGQAGCATTEVLGLGRNIIYYQFFVERNLESCCCRIAASATWGERTVRQEVKLYGLKRWIVYIGCSSGSSNLNDDWTSGSVPSSCGTENDGRC